MKVNPLVVLGTLPVTQQLVGLSYVVAGVAKAVAALVWMAFHQMNISYQSNKIEKSRVFDIPEKSELNRQQIKAEALVAYEGEVSKLSNAGRLMLLGVVTMIPIIGTLGNAILWHIQAQKAREI